jgi:hypothetical protein
MRGHISLAHQNAGTCERGKNNVVSSARRNPHARKLYAH